MDTVRNIEGYKTSRDYKELFEMMTKASVVCVVDYGETGRCRDVAHTLFRDGVYQISARGISYVCAETLEEFIKQCESDNVEFIPPNRAMNIMGQDE